MLAIFSQGRQSIETYLLYGQFKATNVAGVSGLQEEAGAPVRSSGIQRENLKLQTGRLRIELSTSANYCNTVPALDQPVSMNNTF